MASTEVSAILVPEQAAQVERLIRRKTVVQRVMKIQLSLLTVKSLFSGFDTHPRSWECVTRKRQIRYYGIQYSTGIERGSEQKKDLYVVCMIHTLKFRGLIIQLREFIVVVVAIFELLIQYNLLD